VRRRGAQRGAALLAMLAVIALGGAWWIVSGRPAANRIALERSQNAPVLRQAKQALIGWAATQAGGSDLNPGRLPCPEAPANIGTVNEGIASGTCTLPAVGRLPWRTLGINKLQDAAGEPLWYIVSAGWALPNSTTPTLGINSNTAGNLAVNGQANAAVAAIIAPGPPIVLTPNANQTAAGCAARAQVRTPSAPNYLDYLECQNVAGASLRSAMVDNATSPAFNDQFALVSAAEVLAVVEPVVALRIQRDVVPQLQSIYASSEWGTSAANPMFPFPATYADPSTSSFKGTVSASCPAVGARTSCEGLLPLTSATCNAMTNGPCDTTFVQWNLASISAVQTGGTATTFAANCAASTTTQITCAISFSKTLCLFCGQVNVTVQVQGDGSNVGMTLRTLNTALASGLTTLTAPLQTSGAARATYTGTVNGAGALCGSFIGILCNGSVTVTVPIGVFQDHPFLSAAGPTPSNTATTPVAWFWFLVNKWHHVTYYAVAPLHTPGAAGNCAGATCISVSVQGGTALSDKRAVLALAGRSLLGTSGANRALSDFLDSTENTNLDLVFEQAKSNKFFNDRFVSLSP